jgi:transcriptional regulator with XRE-family HTH domain
MSDERLANAVDERIGKRVKGRRLEIDLSQEKLADLVGVTFQQIQKYENGVNRIAASRLWEMAKALGVPVQYFYEGLSVERPGVAEEAAPDLVYDMMATPEGQRLLQIFGTIKNPRLRRRVVELVRVMAEDDDAADEGAG